MWSPFPSLREERAYDATVRQVEEAHHNADFHPSILQHINELPLVWRPNTRALQHIVGVFEKPQERFSSVHTALAGVLSIVTVCQSTQRVWFSSDLFSSNFQPI